MVGEKAAEGTKDERFLGVARRFRRVMPFCGTHLFNFCHLDGYFSAANTERKYKMSYCLDCQLFRIEMHSGERGSRSRAGS